MKVISVRVGELALRVAAQGANKDPLGGAGFRAVAFSGASIPLGQAQLPPVGGPIHTPMEAPGINKGLQQQQRMAEADRPIGHDPAFGQRQDPRANIRPVPVGQDQETAVVGDQLEVAILGAKVPADPAHRISGRRPTG